MIRHTVKPVEALKRLESLCARSEQCESELLTKLSRWGISSDMAEKILARLRAERYVDNGRFARAFVRDKYLFQHWGRQKIRAALRLKRISDGLIDSAIDEEIDEETYRRNAIELLHAKIRTMKEPQSYDNRMRLLRFAYGRGFESVLIIKLLKSPELWTPDEPL